METQNITVTVPRTLLRKVKIVAAKRETSISALVTASLEDIARQDDDYTGATLRLVSRARGGYDLGSGGLVATTRDALHER